MTEVTSRERGAALFESVIALAIVSTSGLAAVQLVQYSLQSEASMNRREAEMAQGERLMAALTLLTRKDLELRLGAHPVGEFIVTVQRPERALFRVGLATTAAPEAELLATVVYRTETAPQ